MNLVTPRLQVGDDCVASRGAPKVMKILLIGSYSGYSHWSMEKFCSMIEFGMARRGHEVRVIRAKPFLGRLVPLGYGALKKWMGYADKFLVFPSHLKRAVGWGDIVHICDHTNSSYTSYLRGVPHVVTCHDLLAVRSSRGEFPEYPVSWTGRRYQEMILAGLNRARFVACVSQQTLRDLLRLSSVGPDRASVIYPGLNYSYFPAPDASERLHCLGIPGDWPFVLHVGTDLWYKNRSGVLSIFQRLTRLAPDFPTLRLVMVGPPLTPARRQFLERHGLGDRVLIRESVTDEDLRALYLQVRRATVPFAV